MNYLSAPWGPAPLRTRLPRPPTPQRSSERQGSGHGNRFWCVTPGDQLRPDVRRSGCGVDGGRRSRLERVGRRIAVGGGRLRVGDLGTYRWAVAGAVVNGDGGRGRTLRDVDARDRRTGR